MASVENEILCRKLRGPKMRVAGFPALDPLCNAVASITATAARKDLRPGIDVTVFGYEVLRHADYLRQLKSPSAIFLLSFPATGGTGLIRAHPRLLGKVLDLSLGGSGTQEDERTTRPLTRIDLAIFGRFVDMICTAFDEAVREVCGRSALGVPVKTKFEEQPGMIRIARDLAELFVIKLSFHIGADRQSAGLDLAFPVSALEPLKADLGQAASPDEAAVETWRTAMQERILDLPLSLDAHIPLGGFSVAELSRLEQGDILELSPGALAEVGLVVETSGGAVTLARGKLGAKGRSKAVRLAETISPGFLQPLIDMRKA